MTNFEKLKGILSDIKISGVKLFGRIETINDAGYILSSCIRCSDCPVYGDCRYSPSCPHSLIDWLSQETDND